MDFPIAMVSKHSAREKSIRHGHLSALDSGCGRGGTEPYLGHSGARGCEKVTIGPAACNSLWSASEGM